MMIGRITRRRRPRVVGVCAAALMLIGVGDLLAQERPRGANRVVRHYDFEDPRDHLEGIPREWVNRLHDPQHDVHLEGFPQWNQSRFSDEHAATGAWSVLLPVDGGSSAMAIASGTVGVFPDADYAISCMVRTESLRHARARLIARLLDSTGKAIQTSEARSEPVRTGGRWRRLEVQVQGDEGAHFIQVELQLVQRRVWEERAPRKHEAWREDRGGRAWFDDVMIFQSPRIDFETNGASNIVLAPEAPTLTVRIQDLTGEPLEMAMTVFDHEGNVVATRDTAAPFTGTPVRWRPDLPALGWYRAVLRVHNGDATVGQSTLDFLWSPPLDPKAQRQRQSFGLIAEGLTAAQRRQLPDLVRRSGAGALTTSIWDRDLTEATLQQWTQEMSGAVTTMLERGVQVTFSFDRLPEKLAYETRIDPLEILRLFGDSSEQWVGYLESVLSRFGERVQRWQVGGADHHGSFWRPDLAENVASAKAKLLDLVPRCMIVTPWSAEQAPDDRTSDFDAATVTIPASVPASSISEYIALWPETTELNLVLETPDPRIYGHRAAILETVKRAVLAHRTGRARVSLNAPWRWTERTLQTHPEPRLGAWRVLSDALAGRTITDEIPLMDGVRLFIATGESGDASGSVLIGWNDSAPPDEAVFSGYLGDGDVSVMDVFGNVTELDSEDGRHEIVLTDMPIYIKGIDPHIAQFRAGLKVTPSFIESRAEKHYVNVQVTNPWPVAASGRVRFARPESWEINPRVTTFTLAPGETRTYPIELYYGLAEESGRRMIEAEVEVVATQTYPMLQIPLPVELGLPNVDLRASYRFAPNDEGEWKDVIVDVFVQNLGSAPQTFELLSRAAGYQDFQSAVSQLSPNDSVIRQFRYENGAEALAGGRIRISLLERNDTGRLNKTIEVPE